MSPDEIQHSMLIATWITTGATCFAAIAALTAAVWAKKIGDRQNQINTRQLALQDYVAISAEPGEGGIIKLINVGKANLYLWGFDVPENVQRFEKPRLISTNANYWVYPPKLPDTQNSYEFEFKLYLIDAFDNKWISENGGILEKRRIIQNDQEVEVIALISWSYKTYRSDWTF